MNFTQLHNHSCFSLLDAIPFPKEIAEYAAKNKMSSIALTDHGNLSGIYEFYKSCKKNGVKPILGCEFYISSDRKIKSKNRMHIIILAKNKIGWKNLMKLSSLSFSEGFYYVPRIDPNLVNELKEGLIVLSACIGGIIGKHIITNKEPKKAYRMAEYFKSMFGNDFYLEMIAIDYEPQSNLNHELQKMSLELNIPITVTGDVHYINKKDYKIHLILLKMKSENFNFKIEDLYFKTPEEIIRILRTHNISDKIITTAMQNTEEISKKVEDFAIELTNYKMPQVSLTERT